MTKPYLYVEVRGWFEDDRNLTLTEDPVSFDSVRVEATDTDSAYQLGAALMDAKHQEPADTEARIHITGELLNDYVVAL